MFIIDLKAYKEHMKILALCERMTDIDKMALSIYMELDDRESIQKLLDALSNGDTVTRIEIISDDAGNIATIQVALR